MVVLAQEEARLLKHNYIGTEHILLGLLHEGEGVAAKVLESLGVSLEAVRSQVEEIIGQGAGATPHVNIPFTPRAKKVFELSLREALQLGHNYIGTEHLLIALVREGEGVAAHCLTHYFALDLKDVRAEVVKVLSSYSRHSTKEESPSVVPLIMRGPAEFADKILPIVVTPEEQWFLVEYLDANGKPSSMTVNSPDGWVADDRPLGFLRIGGHAINLASVITVFQVAGPPAANTITPAGMTPLDPPPAPQPTAVAKRKPWEILEAGGLVVERAAQHLWSECEKQERDVLSALAEAQVNDPHFGGVWANTRIPGGSKVDKDLQLKHKELRLKQWGHDMSIAISRGRARVDNLRQGGVIYIPDDGTPPSFIANTIEGINKLDEILDQYEGLHNDEGRP